MFRFALNNLISRPLRSILAIMGLTVAIAGMVGLFSVAAGVDALVNKTFGKIPGLVAMQAGAPIPLFSRLPRAWVREIGDTPGVSIARLELWTRANIVEGRAPFNPPRMLFGLDVDATLRLKKSVYRDDLVRGRFLTRDDVGHSRCVISQTIAKEFQKDVGDTLTVDGRAFEILGVYDCGSILLDVAIVMDETVLRDMARLGDDMVSAIYMERDASVTDDQLTQRLREKFKGRKLAPVMSTAAIISAAMPQTNDPWLDLGRAAWRALGTMRGPDTPEEIAEQAASEHLERESTNALGSGSTKREGMKSDASPDAIEIRTASDWGERIEEFSADLDIILVLMTAIGVIIALLSILNTMMMSVTERLVEFGILRANGWTPRDVLILIAWESGLLGLAGGLLGVSIGWAAAHAINWYWPSKVNLDPSLPLLQFSLLFSMALGIFGGLYPAAWATRMSPMTAIRRA